MSEALIEESFIAPSQSGWVLIFYENDLRVDCQFNSQHMCAVWCTMTARDGGPFEV